MSACNNGHEKIVKMLLTHGADVNSTNSFGDTPFSLAQNENIRKLLRVNSVVTTDAVFDQLNMSHAFDADSKQDLLEFMGKPKGGKRKSNKRRKTKKIINRKRRKTNRKRR
jgi:ankyrin repeat protein